MYLCIYVYMYICIYVYMYICIGPREWTGTHLAACSEATTGARRDDSKVAHELQERNLPFDLPGRGAMLLGGVAALGRQVVVAEGGSALATFCAEILEVVLAENVKVGLYILEISICKVFGSGRIEGRD